MGTFTNSGSTFASDSSVGTIAWASPGNAQISDSTNATAAILITQVTNYLKATNYAFLVPSDATITGVTVKITRSSNLGVGVSDTTVSLVKGGTVSGNNKAAGGVWPSGSTVGTYGSATDLWGLTLTPTDINASTFGAVVNITGGATDTAQVDFIQIIVDWTGSNKNGNLPPQIKVGNGMSRSEL